MFVYLDAIGLRVRIANRVVSAPVLVALGVKADGQKAVLDLELLQSESGECWGGFVEGLVGRGLKRSCLVIIDGNKGLRAAVDKNWPGIEVQHCTVHKLRNLERHTPRHALEEVKSDYHGIIRPSLWNKRGKFTENFIVKWKKLAPKVVVSLEEAGEELLTFYGFPNSQWKSLRTTNAIERLNGEFRRRVENAGLVAQCTSCRVPTVRVNHQWSDSDAADRRMARSKADDFVEGRIRGVV